MYGRRSKVKRNSMYRGPRQRAGRSLISGPESYFRLMRRTMGMSGTTGWEVWARSDNSLSTQCRLGAPQIHFLSLPTPLHVAYPNAVDCQSIQDRTGRNQGQFFTFASSAVKDSGNIAQGSSDCLHYRGHEGQRPLVPRMGVSQADKDLCQERFCPLRQQRPRRRAGVGKGRICSERGGCVVSRIVRWHISRGDHAHRTTTAASTPGPGTTATDVVDGVVLNELQRELLASL
ncbi:hypothetical protein BaRGS_00030984 [Batillaria attramentaria]|uniref:Uncharacterized protein n=1 Tax=Batillaria attramentaria TaxID=370345 RepID=A0ABD0JRQ9_9CAEN